MLKTFQISLLAALAFGLQLVSQGQESVQELKTFQTIADFKAEAAAAKTNFQARVRGTVTFQFQKQSVYIQDETGGLFAGTTKTNEVRVGDIVEATGLSNYSGFSPIITEAELRWVGRTNPPAPLNVTARDALSKEYDARLVRLEGRLLEMSAKGGLVVIRMLDGAVPFQGELVGTNVPAEWLEWEPQSLLELTGPISVAADGSRQARSFRLLLGESSDVIRLEAPPWWTVQRTLKVVTGLGILVLGVLVWVAALNHQVRQQTRMLRERLEREQTLQSQYQDLFENAHELIFTLSPEGKIRSVNRAAESVLKKNREELRESDFREIISPKEKGRFERLLEESLKGGTMLQEFTVRSEEGEKLSLELSTYCLKENGTPTGLQIIGRDVTERKKAEEEIARLNQSLEKRVEERTAQLEAANKELEAFSYSVSHDLRAPLRAIEGFAQILMEEYDGKHSTEANELIQGMQKNARKMAQLIDDLLSFSRLTRSPLEKGQLKMEDLFKGAFEELRVHQNAYNTELVLHPLPPGCGDAAMMRQVAVNLLSNAIKYSRKVEKPRIEVGSEKRGNEVVYYVKDNGVGFDMKYASKLFGVFQRLHSEREFEGTGVGLAIVQRIIHRHGGKIWAEAAPHKGATFYFTLQCPEPA